jgi:hypothetical protein
MAAGALCQRAPGPGPTPRARATGWPDVPIGSGGAGGHGTRVPTPPALVVRGPRRAPPAAAPPVAGGATPTPESAPGLRIHLLGDFRVAAGPRVLGEADWWLRKARSLAKLLALAPGDVLPLLAALVDQALVVAEAGEGGLVRYRLLETLRAYGHERLREAGETAATERQFVAYCLNLAEQAAPALHAPEWAAWLERLEQEHDNLRLARRYARDHAPGAIARRLEALCRCGPARAGLAGGRWESEAQRCAR